MTLIVETRHFKKKVHKVEQESTLTYAVPFWRHGVQTPENPEKTADEIPRTPSAYVPMPTEVRLAGARIVNTKMFTPEYLANLRHLSQKDGVLLAEVNLATYGVLPTLRGLTRNFPEEVMRPVLDELGLLAVRGVTVSEDMDCMYLARRTQVACSGKIDTLPAGTVSEGDTLPSALRNEAFEEMGLKIGEDCEAEWIGLVRGRSDAPNPNVISLIRTSWSLKEIEQNTNKKEHDKVFPFRIDERIFEECIRNNIIPGTSEYGGITDAGLGAILGLCGKVFNKEWNKNIVKELGESGQAKIIERALYA